MKADRLLEHYCDMNASMRAELLATVSNFLQQGRKVEYRNETYHHIEDLTVDIEAYCAEIKMMKVASEKAS